MHGHQQQYPFNGEPDYEQFAKTTDSCLGDAVCIVTSTGPEGQLPDTANSICYYALGTITATFNIVYGPSQLPANPGTAQELSGSGKCISGTGAYKKVKCTATWTGKYDEAGSDGSNGGSLPGFIIGEVTTTTTYK